MNLADLQSIAPGDSIIGACGFYDELQVISAGTALTTAYGKPLQFVTERPLLLKYGRTRMPVTIEEGGPEILSKGES